jgi:hypothetical protein
MQPTTGGVLVAVGVAVDAKVGVAVGVVVCRFLKRVDTQVATDTVTWNSAGVTGSQPLCISSHTRYTPNGRLLNR